MMPEALIWGASGGIGRALVTQLKAEGWRVYGAARNEENIPAEADATYPFDANDPQSVEQVALLLAQDIEDSLDLMVYAAGGVVPGPFDKLDPAGWQATMAANLDGAYLAARSSLNLLSKTGQMMFIGAYVHKITLPRMGAYATAKAGLETMVAILQKENRKRPITLVRPPAVDTDFWDNVPFSKPESALDPAEVAAAMLRHAAEGGGGSLDL